MSSSSRNTDSSLLQALEVVVGVVIAMNISIMIRIVIHISVLVYRLHVCRRRVAAVLVVGKTVARR